MRIVITGAASGIGAASAARCIASGHDVIGIDIRAGARDDMAWISADLTDPVARAKAAAVIDGPLDGLVNAAGLPPRDGTEARILALNTFALIALTEALLPRMTPGASVVSLASKAGARWRENIAQAGRLLALPGADALPGFVKDEGIDPVRAYDLSKEALILWTKRQTQRFRDLGIRANTVSPAATETPILDDFMRAFGERATRGHDLMGRAGTADEVAAVVAFLLSPDSGWMKGVDLPVDGGLDAMLDIARREG